MSTVPPVIPDCRKADADHLKLLAIFHFIGAGLAAIAGGFLYLHHLFLGAIFSNPKMSEQQNSPPPPAEIIAIFKWFYLLMGAWFLLSLALNALAGWCLLRRQARIFTLVVAGINCIHVPLGTVLGVFTIVVLMRDSVRRLYEEVTAS